MKYHRVQTHITPLLQRDSKSCLILVGPLLQGDWQSDSAMRKLMVKWLSWKAL